MLYDPISGEDLYVAALERIAALEAEVKKLREVQPFCVCKYDWTDGTGWCQECGKERKE